MHALPPEVDLRPEADDPEELTWALQTAQTKWSEGDAREAVRWLQRAAMTAHEAGLGERCEHIKRAVGLLKEPSVSEAATTRMQPDSAGNGAETQSHVPHARMDQTHVSAGQGRHARVDAAAYALTDPALRNPALSATVPADPPAGARPAAPPRPPAPSHMLRTTPSAGAAAPEVNTREASERDPDTNGPGSLMWESQPAPTRTSGPADVRHAIRVAFGQAPDGSLQVVALSAGESPKPGTREGLLVALDGEPPLT